ncbi:phosphopentomutase [Guggenheimella bovis]
MKRAIVIVLDSFGIGNSPDADQFNDTGANTLKHIEESVGLKLPNLSRLGLSEIDGVDALGHTEPMGSYARLFEVSNGKDTTIGHWELMGLSIERPFPVYPNGFPEDVMKTFEEAVGRKTLVNKPYSGTEILNDYGEEHMKTGMPIVYTSSDSVFQIACHEEVVPLEELYSMCEKAREILRGEHAVARVIARPFVGSKEEGFTRTSNRRDFSLDPFEDTVLNKLQKSGKDVIGVGKISDIFNGSGITKSIHTDNNEDGILKTIDVMKKDFDGLLFTNLVDFDAQYGHRRNPKGYRDALELFDSYLPEILKNMREEDLLILTADHGNDPTYRGTDHTREAVPVLLYKKNMKAENKGTKKGFFHVAKTLEAFFELPDHFPGVSLL